MTSRRNPIVWLAAAFVIGAVAGGTVGIFGFIAVVGGQRDPSGAITAPTLAIEPTATGAEPTLPPAEPTATAEESAAPPTPDAAGGALTGQAIFRIVPGESAARYVVSEQDPLATVVGITDQVAGDVRVDFDRINNSEIGTIRINVRTLTTDEVQRDDSVRFILESFQPEHEFAEFVPSSVFGLRVTPATIGMSYRIQVAGDFTVHGTTRRVTFFGPVTLVSADEIRGFLATTISLTDYGLFAEGLVMHIVSDEMMLEIDFVARRVAE